MCRKIATMLMLNFLLLFAQNSFLEGIRAEDIVVDKIQPASYETIQQIESEGSDYWFGPVLSTAYSPNSLLTAEARTDKPGGEIIGLWIVDSESGTAKKIEEGLVDDLKWSSSGKYLSFLKFEYLEEATKKCSLYGNQKPAYNSVRLCTYDARTEELQGIIFLVNNFYVEHKWAPIGDYLAYSYADTDKKKSILVVFDMANNNKFIIDEFCLWDGWNFCWSPNGEMIVYTKPLKIDMNINEEVPLEAEIFIANRNQSGRKQMTNTSEAELYVKWLPDGLNIVTEVKDPADSHYMPEYLNLILKREVEK